LIASERTGKDIDILLEFQKLSKFIGKNFSPRQAWNMVPAPDDRPVQ
jgi:hypothetical protein